MPKIIIAALFLLVLSFRLSAQTAHTDTLFALHSGDTLIARQSYVVMDTSAFRKVVSDKAQLKADSSIITQLQAVTQNDVKKDSLYKDDLTREQSIANEYKQVWTDATKAQADHWYDSKVLYYGLGVISVFLSAEALHLVK